VNTDELLAERQKISGNYEDHARIFIPMIEQLINEHGWERLTNCMKETIYMTIFKYARVLSGDPFFLDHWQDVVGYNQLVIDQLQSSNPKL
jgi:hypothetical protein